ncbi:MAG: hypothetical protein ABJN26_17520 [Stappiaceae bacterium]
MELSIQTSSQSTQLLQIQQNSPSSLFNNGKADEAAKGRPESVLDIAAKKAEKDAVIIERLQDLTDRLKSRRDDRLGNEGDYRATARQAEIARLRDSIEEKPDARFDTDVGGSTSIRYEAASVSTTRIEIDGIEAEFQSFQRVSFDGENLTVRNGSFSNIEGERDGVSFSSQSASVSNLYIGALDKAPGDLIDAFA